jgi:hypothetical protein
MQTWVTPGPYGQYHLIGAEEVKITPNFSFAKGTAEDSVCLCAKKRSVGKAGR